MHRKHRTYRWIAATALAAALTPFMLADDAMSSEGSRADLLAHLEASRTEFLASVKGLSDEQLNWKPAEDRWSIAECSEHLAAAEELIYGAAQGALDAPATGSATGSAETAAAHDQDITKVVPDRSQKFNAPDPLQPTNRYGSQRATMKAWKKARKQSLRAAKTSDGLRTHSAEHPVFGDLDAYGWLLFTSSHTERHTAQIEEVKAEAGYPSR